MITYSEEKIFPNVKPYSVILHQVDCKGNSITGIAKSINMAFNGWYPNYRSYCKWFKDIHEDEIRGTFHRFEIPEKNVIICSAFCQNGSSKNFCEPDFKSWEKVLSKILKQTEKINTMFNNNWTIHVAENIGATKKIVVNSDLIDLFSKYFSESTKANLVIHPA